MRRLKLQAPDLGVRRLRSSVLLLVFLPLFVLYGLTATYNTAVLSPDPVATALPAWQLAEHRNLTLDAAPLDNVWINEHGGRSVSDRMPGVIAAGVPFYLAARPFTSGFSIWPAAIGAALMAAAAMALLALCLEPLIGRRAAVLGAWIAALATGTWSVSADALWPHSVNQLLLAAAMLAAAKRRYLLVGLLFLLAEPVRTHLALAAFTFGVAGSLRERSWKPAALVGGPAVLGVLLVPLYTHHVFGFYSFKPQYPTVAGPVASGGSQDPVLNLLGFFLSPDRGLLTMSPFLILLLPGLRSAWREAPAWVRGAALGGFLYLLLQARLNHFSGGARFWGYRLPLESLTLWAPLLAIAWRRAVAPSATRAAFFAAAVCVSVSLQAIGAILFTPLMTWPAWLHFWPAHLLAAGPHRPWVVAILACGVLASAAILLRARRQERVVPISQKDRVDSPPGGRSDPT